MLRGYRKWAILVCFIIGIILDIIYYQNYIADFPTFVITGEQLLTDEQHGIIKDFEVNDDSSITSLSKDPWISWTFDEPVLIEEMTIVLNSISKEAACGQVYPFDSSGGKEYNLSAGENKIKFHKSWRDAEVQGLRFDLATEEDVFLDIEKIIINGHSLLFWEMQLQAMLLFGAVVLLLVVFWSWSDFVKEKEDKRYWIAGSIALGMQIGLCCNFAARFMKGSTQGYVLLWYLAVIVVMTILQVLILKCYSGKSVVASEETVTGSVIIKNCLLLLVIWGLSALLNFAIIEILGGVQYDFTQKLDFVFNMLIYLEVILVIYLIIRRPGIALIVANVPILLLGLVNHYYYQFRGEPFEFASAIMADTALSVLDNYRFAINDSLWFVIFAEGLFLVLVIAVICRHKLNIPKKIKLCLIVPAVVIPVVIAVKLPPVSFWDIADCSRREGYLYSFLGYLKELGTPDEPEGYSVKKAESILKKFDAVEGSNSPDIVVIMNEAFADLPAIYDFETNTDALPYIHSLTENTVKGQVLVSVFGGTTANSEYEFLTGNSMALMPGGSVPFVQYIKEEQQSLAMLLKNRGYVTTGYHSYYKDGYHRSTAYPLLGIDSFYGLEDTLPETEMIRSYLSDRANYKNMEYLYEKNLSDSPQFLFNVTMQNHGDYASEKPAIEVTCQPTKETMQTPQLQEYLSLLRESDEAFKELVEYYENVDRDTIILMFGDHQPGLGDASYGAMDSRLVAADAAIEEKQKKYVTSFVIWANFDIEEQENVFLSLNYLRPFLLDVAGMDLSSYDSFLLELSNTYPAINLYGYYDREGNWYGADNLGDSKLQQYSWLQYYNTFDIKKLDSTYYTE